LTGRADRREASSGEDFADCADRFRISGWIAKCAMYLA
jgi:hypothetical protein